MNATFESTESLQKKIDHLILELDQKDRMQRKIQFLLDIRGLLVINKIIGQYVEFGVYRGEMMYAAQKILGGNISKFIGLDTFEGLPEPAFADQEKFVFERAGFMSAAEQQVAKMTTDAQAQLIKGDFRDLRIADAAKSTFDNLSVVVIDSNWPSSNEAALDLAIPYVQNGTIVFFDDYFTATRDGNYTNDKIEIIQKQGEIKFHYFNTYAPCAVAYIIEKQT